MFAFIWIYHYLNVLLGLNNISYNRRTFKYKLYHWTTIIYSAVISLASLIMLHISSYVYWYHLGIAFHGDGAIQFVTLMSLITKYILKLIVILENWFKRKQIFIIFNKFQYLLKYYAAIKSNEREKSFKFDTTTRNLLIAKAISVLLKVSMIIFHLSHTLANVPPCNGSSCELYIFTNSYYTSYFALCVLIIDSNIYLGLIFIHMCVHIVTQRLKRIAQDIYIMKLLNKSFTRNNFSIRQKWLNSLKRDILKIAKFEKVLNNYIQDFIHTFQFQFLLMLLWLSVSLMSTIFTFFLLVSPFLTDYKRMNYHIIRKFILMLLTFLSRLSNVMLFFNICEVLFKSFKEMREWANEIIFNTFLEAKELFSKEEIIQNVSIFNTFVH